MQIVVNSLLINYSIAGNGKKEILMLHGWGDDSSTFNLLSQQLSKTYKVIRLDLPGFGASQPPNSVWSLDDYAQFIAQFLNKIKTSSLFCVIGHSNGGSLAIKTLATQRIKVERMVLIASAGIRTPHSPKNITLKVIAKTGKAVTFWLPSHQQKQLQKKFYGSIGSDMLVAPHLIETFKKTVKEDIKQYAKKIKIPTLLIYGDKDKATPVRFGDQFSQLIIGSKLIVVSDAGHFVHHDQAVYVIQLIQEFLE
jgi:pimeloyl-ACP methyl ester carboxylesterase